MGHIRGHDCRDLLVSCISSWCNHDAKLNGDWLPDETVLPEQFTHHACSSLSGIGQWGVRVLCQ